MARGIGRNPIPAKPGIYAGRRRDVFRHLLSSKPSATLYVGLTVNLYRRVWEHKNKLVPGFTRKYGVDRLVWFEIHDNHEAALRREKQLKEWRQDWKINLIEANNPRRIDLFGELRL